MGIHGFQSFYGDLYNTVSIDTIFNKFMIIDINLYIYKYVIGIRKSGCDMKTLDGKITTHLHALKKTLNNFIDNNIFPIAVFDGKTPEIKESTVEKRKEKCEIATKKCEEILEELKNENNIHVMNNIDEYNIIDDEFIKNFKKSFSLKSSMIEDCKKFMNLAGIPYVTAANEADSQCVALYHYYKNICAGIYSEDSDPILFGADKLYKDIDLKTNTIKVIEYNSIIKYLQTKTNNICKRYNKKEIIINREKFIDFSIIMGNDYCNGVRIGGGNNKDKLFELFVSNDLDMYKFIKYLENENMKYSKLIYYISDNFINKWLECKNMYYTASVVNPETIDIMYKAIDEKNIREFMSKTNFRGDIINHLIKSLKSSYVALKNSIRVDIKKQKEKENISELSSEWIKTKSSKGKKNKQLFL